MYERGLELGTFRSRERCLNRLPKLHRYIEHCNRINGHIHLLHITYLHIHIKKNLTLISEQCVANYYEDNTIAKVSYLSAFKIF